jgi:acyl-CoA thioester hydrolase
MTDADLALRATFGIWAHEKVRFGDLDRHDHVNNVALCSMFENARVELRETLAPEAAHDPALAWVLVTFAVTFLGTMHYPGTVAVGTRPLEIGRTSFVFGQAAFDGERCLATARAKTVCVERATGRPTPLPSVYREVLERSL